MKTVRIHPAARHPVDPRAVFVLVLCLVSGIPLLLGVTDPGSIERTLPHWALLLWGGGLVLGALTTLAGMSRQTAGGVIAEQIGSVTVGAATLFYGSIILLNAASPKGDGITGSTLLGAGIIFAWGAANLWRWFQLQSYLKHAQAKATALRGEPEHDH